MGKKKRTTGVVVGELIDNAIGGIGSIFSKVANKPREVVRKLDAENGALGDRAKVLEILHGYGSVNLKAHAKAVEFMRQNGISPDQAQGMRERFR